MIFEEIMHDYYSNCASVAHVALLSCSVGSHAGRVVIRFCLVRRSTKVLEGASEPVCGCPLHGHSFNSLRPVVSSNATGRIVRFD